MTLRAPHLTRFGPRERNTELLTWTHGVQPGLNPTPFIRRQWDWPVPASPRRSIELLTWTEGLSQTSLALTIPKRQSEWPNPTLRVPNLELRTWTEGLPQTALALTIPQRQADWPNPRGKPRTDQLGITEWIGGLPPLTVVSTPFAQTDWPNPAPKKRDPSLLTWLDGLPQTALSLTVPPVQLDWPNPVVGRPNLDLRTWTYSTQLGDPPLAQYDWPNPLIPRTLRQDWVGTNQQPLHGPQVMPPMARTWTVPPGRQPLVQQWESSFPLSLGLLEPAPVFSGPIPDIIAGFNSGAHAYALGAYFTDADSYAIAPAVEPGWTFDTVTGELTIDTDAVGVFGQYIVTATNAGGDTPSNEFTVAVLRLSGGGITTFLSYGWPWHTWKVH